jgi:hypothetical protein
MKAKKNKSFNKDVKVPYKSYEPEPELKTHRYDAATLFLIIFSSLRSWQMPNRLMPPRGHYTFLDQFPGQFFANLKGRPIQFVEQFPDKFFTKRKGTLNSIFMDYFHGLFRFPAWLLLCQN